MKAAQPTQNAKQSSVRGLGREIYSTTGLCVRLADFRSAYYAGGLPVIGAPLDQEGVAGATCAVYQRWKLAVGSSLSVSLAGRYDYQYFKPDSGAVARFDALSPALAVSASPAESLTIDAAVLQSFRAPTIAQLYDNRPVSVYNPFVGAPVNLRLSSHDLRPQLARMVSLAGTFGTTKGMRFEAGGYHAWIRDEIDFDLARLRYDNIGRSVHRGADISASGQWGGILALVAGLAWNQAVYDDERSGRRIPGVPELIGSGQVAVRPRANLTVSAVLTAVSRMYLDEDNRRQLPGYVELHGLASYRRGELQFVAGVDNLLDRTGPVNGYMDPQSGSALLFPAPSRHIRFGVAGELR